MNLFTLTSAITTPQVNIPLKIVKYESTKHLKPKTVNQMMILNHKLHHNPTPQHAIGDLCVWIPSAPGRYWLRKETTPSSVAGEHNLMI